MKVTALIPMFNRELYIREAIESVLKQTHKEIDIIVYDDGSVDNSVVIVKDMQKTNPNIKLIEGINNKGVSASRNALLDACETEYAFWQDSDDVSVSTRVEYQLKEIHGGCIIFTNWAWLKFHPKTKKWTLAAKPLNANAFASIMFYVDKTKRFDTTKIAGEDWDWIGKMTKRYKTKNVKQILYLVRYHPDRIGTWKIKLRSAFTETEIKTVPYGELIRMYKERFGV